GKEIIAQLLAEVQERERITLFTGAEIVEKSGSVGNFQVKVRVGGRRRQEISLNVGAVVVATGFDVYRPAACEYGYGFTGVVTLPEYWDLLASANGNLIYRGKEIKDVIYIYCVGSRQDPEKENAHSYCSRYCCSAAVYAALQTAEINPQIRQYHLYRDMRTYGKSELLFTRAREQGVRFLKFAGDNPPRVEEQAGGRLQVTVCDLLTYGEEVEIRADLVVLVTGMVPRENEQLVKVLKLPLGKDGFFNEIHPKLRPVETVVDGVFICGAAQGPKDYPESVASALAAVTQSAALLKKGYVELEPLVATVDPERCQWCGECAAVCPYAAIEKGQYLYRQVAWVNEAVCKGCGGCAPVCPGQAIDLRGYTDAQIKAMIDGLLKGGL
ncbi:MAG: CoB--CoM heterodisulfide reductase iron-sulfur subunit A family protein, partial [Desulfotomaculales bacterium]